MVISNSDYVIERAHPHDAEWIVHAQIAMAKETENLELNLPVVVKGINYIFEHPSHGFYVIVKMNKRSPIGCLLILKEWSDWRNGYVWWIHSVYIVPEYRKHGIFSRMFEYVEDLARKSGARGLRLYVDKKNVSAQAVYEKLGMNKDHYELFEKMF